MIRSARKSLLVRLLGAYLLFVALVLGTGIAVNMIMQRQLQSDVHTADLALAQAIARDMSAKLQDARLSLDELSKFDEVRRGDVAAMARAFEAFKVARQDIDRVYWYDSNGVLRVSVPENVRTQGSDFSQRRLFQRASRSGNTVFDAGIVDLSTYQAVAALARPVRDSRGALVGVLATNLSLDDFSAALKAIVDEQARQQKPLNISLIDDQGILIASPDQERLLQPMLDELPGAAAALRGQSATALAPGPGKQNWLWSAVPIPDSGWAIVVQRPANSALATVATFKNWLLVMAALFAIGGLLFWVELARLLIRPLQRLATVYQALRPADAPLAERTLALSRRPDEVGGLARALQRLERDVRTQLLELRTLLDTSKVVVETLDAQTIAEAIIQEVQRLIDVQAAAVLVQEATGVMRVLASAGRRPDYDEVVRRRPLDAVSPAARALQEDRPVQMVARDGEVFPPLSYEEGFRSALAIPIRSQHAGDIVLVVHRRLPQPFTDREVNLLMTFAHYAALAWEHAVLYERSDVRLREEQQTLAAIMSSMSDGLVLTGVDGDVLYSNPGAAALLGRSPAELENGTLDTVHAALQAAAVRPDTYVNQRLEAEAGDMPAWIVEMNGTHGHRSIQLRVFDVRGETGTVIGRGLLLRDVTREQEIAQFKTTLLGAVGHELRTPLSVIKMHASTLLQPDVAWSATEQRQFIGEISDEADQLARLVSNLLDLSRVEAGLLQVARVPCSLEQLARRTVGRLREPMPHVTFDLPYDLPLVAIDEPRIELVLHNLLVNAQAYGAGDVRVSAVADGESVVVRVTDNGPGIAPDELPHLFERFYRAARGQQRRSGGIGLGLAICKAFVEAHGGRIWAENGANGTTFAFSLPVEPIRAEASRAEAALASSI